MDDTKTLAQAVAGGALGSALMDALVRKGVLTVEEAIDVVDDAVSRVSRHDEVSKEAFGTLCATQIALSKSGEKSGV